MPGAIDLLFPVVGNGREVAQVRNAVCRPVPGIQGHFAGAGANPADTEFCDDGLKAKPARDWRRPRCRLE